MGEKSKYIGELGEDLADRLLKRLGWSVSGDWNDDIDCNHSEHKTFKDKEKKTHGIDAVFSYTNPYSNKDDILIVEAKALAWLADGKNKTESSLGKQLDEFINVVLEKAVCSTRSDRFRKTYGHTENIGQTKVILCYYVHDQFSPQVWTMIKQKVVLATANSNIPVYLIDNDRMERALTALNFLEKKALELHCDKPHFFFPELTRNHSSNFWATHIPIEYLFSSFYLSRIRGQKGEKFYIIYQGSYSHEAVKRFFAALGRLQIPSFDNLVLVPLSVSKTAGDRHALSAAIENGNIEVDGRKLVLTVESPDKVLPSFAWIGG